MTVSKGTHAARASARVETALSTGPAVFYTYFINPRQLVVYTAPHPQDQENHANGTMLGEIPITVRGIDYEGVIVWLDFNGQHVSHPVEDRTGQYDAQGLRTDRMETRGGLYMKETSDAAKKSLKDILFSRVSKWIEEDGEEVQELFTLYLESLSAEYLSNGAATVKRLMDAARRVSQSVTAIEIALDESHEALAHTLTKEHDTLHRGVSVKITVGS